MELPRYIKLDFLLVILGISILGASFYFGVLNPIQNMTIFHAMAFFVSMILGSIFFMFGFSEMLKNYTSEIKIIKLEQEVKELTFKKQIEKLKKGKN